MDFSNSDIDHIRTPVRSAFSMFRTMVLRSPRIRISSIWTPLGEPISVLSGALRRVYVHILQFYILYYSMLGKLFLVTYSANTELSVLSKLMYSVYIHVLLPFTILFPAPLGLLSRVLLNVFFM